MVVGMIFESIPTTVGDHDRGDLVRDSRPIWWEVNGIQLLLGNLVISLVEVRRASAPGSVTVADKVFGSCQDIGWSQRAVRPLESYDGSCTIGCIIRGNLAIPLVSASPANILWRTFARSKRPANTGPQHLVTGCLLYLRDQRRIVHSSQPDVLWEERGSIHIVVSVDRISPVDERNL